MTSEPMIYVVDDDQGARESVCALVKSLNGHCRQFASAEEFLQAYEPEIEGCLVTDLRMRGMSGLDLQAEITRRGWVLPIILVSGYVDVRSAVQAMKGGAEQVLKKPYSDQDLWDAIQAALRHYSEIRVAQENRKSLQEKFAQLNPGERQVLDLVASGLPNKAVAHRLDIGIRTVEDRRRRVMDKLGVDSFAALMREYGKLQALESA